MSQEALAQEQERERDATRRHQIAGVIMALNPRKKEITLQVRTPEGSVPVTIEAPGEIRWLRYAPDSLKPEDARPTSFSELKVGDQLRARGQRSSDGMRFTADEIISGALTRISGQITGVDSSAHTLTMKSGPMGHRVTVTVGEKTILKRLRPEVSSRLMSTTPDVTRAGDSSKKQAAAERAGGVSRNLQQLWASLPAIPLADLKEGETVLVFGSTGTEAARITAISVLTGDAALITRLQGEASQNAQEMNPGLPGDVLGGGTNRVEQPKSRPDPP